MQFAENLMNDENPFSSQNNSQGNKVAFGFNNKIFSNENFDVINYWKNVEFIFNDILNNVNNIRVINYTFLKFNYTFLKFNY